jgi:pilus assembly protein Flp/PilA
MTYITDFLHDEEGVTAIEYGMIAALIAVALIVGATSLGVGLSTLFSNLAACFNTGNCTF